MPSLEGISPVKERVPTAEDLRHRKELTIIMREIRSMPAPGSGPFPTTEEMIREDRDR